MSEAALKEETTKAVAKRKNGGTPTLAVNNDPVSSDVAWLQTIERLAPAVGIEGVRELMTMRREEQARLAEREFNAAMAEAQAALVPIARNQRNNQTNSNYADLAAIADAAMPIIYAHGFGVITSEFESKKVDHLGVACEVTHRSGHSKRYEFNVPIDGTGMRGNANKTATHAYGSTLSYGERYAKCKVFGIATKDDDGNKAQPESEFITPEQVAKIQSLIVEVGADIQKFLALGEVERIEDIYASRYDKVIGMLEAKRRARK